MNDENMESSGSSSDEFDIEKDLLSKAKEIEAQLSSNKFLYDQHIEVIEIYRKLADLISMRDAYQRFHECFPLTPKIWLEWIKDEMRIANTEEEKREVLSLFEKAVNDYQSVELWIEYAQYSLSTCGIETARAVLEKGITAVGLHVSDGHLLWDFIREIEHAQLSLFQEKSDKWISQVTRLANVFKRQLSVPLLNIDNTYLEFCQWCDTIPDGIIDKKIIESRYQKSCELLEEFKPFEDKLLVAEFDELYDIYKEYIKIVKDPSTVLCLYERAVVKLCLNPEVWDDYIEYSFKMKEVALSVTNKAIRNCTWVEHLWIQRMRVLEWHGAEEKDIVSCFEQGIASINPSGSLELCLCFLEYYRRNTDQVKLSKIFSQMLTLILPEYDPAYKLRRWYARFLYSIGDIANARKTWNHILDDSNIKGTASIWLEYANLERQFGGEANAVTKIFKRALSSCGMWTQYISEEWMKFEREDGTLDSVIACEKLCKKALKDNVPVQTELTETVQQFRNQKRKQYDRSQDYTETKKPKISYEKPKSLTTTTTSKPIEKNPKTTVFVSNLHHEVTEQDLKKLFPNALNINIVLGNKGKSRGFGFIEFSKEEEVMTALARDRVPIDGRPVYISELKTDNNKKEGKDFKYATTTEEHKLFVKGLPPSKTQEDVENIFKQYNPLSVRLVIRKDGQSKGLAYVEFKSKEEAQKALKLDSTKIDNHIISVAISAPPPKKLNTNQVASTEPTRHARSRLEFIPRTLQIKNKPDEKMEVNGGNSNKTVIKSNADFRNMFLKK